MGNCCLKNQFHEPNRPVSVVHATAEGNRVKFTHELNKASKGLNKTSKTSPDRSHIIHKTSSGSPSARKSKRYKDDRRRTQGRLKNSHASSNTQIVSGAKHREERRQGRRTAGRDQPPQKPSSSHVDRPHCFCYNMLRDATNNFSKKNFLGEGGFGDVYKGHVTFYTMEAAKPNEGFPVAVKRLVRSRPQGYEAWKTEVEILGSLSHPNIVRLIGCCREGTHKMIVYEYMSKGSLACCLFRDHRRELNWSTRIRITIGAARGLAYLHNNSAKPIIHRDIKASNVLLDSKYNAKISDFGLAKYGPEDEDDHLITKIIGTKGYFAPEYFKSGLLTVKADVYSFGVVLLEILSGSSVDTRCSKGQAGDLVQRAKPLLSSGNARELCSVIDARLGRSVPMEEAHKFAELTCQCLDEDPRGRPAMDEVVARLEQLQPGIDCPRDAAYSACPPPSTRKGSKRNSR